MTTNRNLMKWKIRLMTTKKTSCSLKESIMSKVKQFKRLDMGSNTQMKMKKSDF